MKKFLYILGITLFCLSNYEGLRSNPHLPLTKNPLESSHPSTIWVETKLTELLDRTIEAKRYWLKIEDQPSYRFITRPLYHWISFSWQTEINEHLSHLNGLQDLLSSALGKLVSNDPEEVNKTKHSMYSLSLKANGILKTHGVPFHIKRNWFFYIGTTVALYYFFKAYNNYIATHTNIIINKKYDEEVTAALRDSKNSERHGITREEDIITVSSRKEDVTEFLQKLASHNVNEHTLKDVTIYDLRRAPLDENGQFIGKTFLYTCLINPIKNIWTKIKRDRVVKNIEYSPEEKAANAQATEEALVKLLDHAAQYPEEYPTIANAPYYKRYGTFKGLALVRLEEYRKPVDRTFMEYIKSEAKDVLPQLVDTLAKQDTKKWGPWLASIFKNWLPTDPDVQNSVGFDAYQYWLSWFQEQYPAIQYNLNTFLNALEFLTESCKTVPIWLTLYLGKRTVNDVSEWRHNHYYREPLRYDLKDFINFLDENLYTHLTNPNFKGLHYYWIARLKRYKSFMGNKDRIYFEKDLEKLTRGATINHEIEILRSLLYHEVNHY